MESSHFQTPKKEKPLQWQQGEHFSWYCSAGCLRVGSKQDGVWPVSTSEKQFQEDRLWKGQHASCDQGYQSMLGG